MKRIIMVCLLFAFSFIIIGCSRSKRITQAYFVGNSYKEKEFELTYISCLSSDNRIIVEYSMVILDKNKVDKIQRAYALSTNSSSSREVAPIELYFNDIKQDYTSDVAYPNDNVNVKLVFESDNISSVCHVVVSEYVGDRRFDLTIIKNG